MKKVMLVFALIPMIAWAEWWYEEIDGINWYFDNSWAYGYRVCVVGFDDRDLPPSGAISIPSSTLDGLPVTGIGDYAFSSRNYRKVTSVTIPEGVTSIGDYAFATCSALKAVSIPSSVKQIGSGVFYYCTSLNEVVIPEGVTSIGDFAFYICSSLTKVTVPSSVTSIGEQAFYDCESLKSVTIPEGVPSIGYWTFMDCRSLESVTIPRSVTSIGEGAFTACTSLTEVTIPMSVSRLGVSNLDENLLPTSVFSGCCSLRSIRVEDGNPTYFSVDGFLCDKKSAELIQCPEGKTGSVTIPAGVKSIGDHAFGQCFQLTEVTISSSVTNIGDGAFCWCERLMSVAIPGSVKRIGSKAFSDCHSLMSVTIPSSVASIENDAFSWCTSLVSVVIQPGVKSIGDYAFAWCGSLLSVQIPSSVTCIGYMAFADCDGVRCVTIPACVMRLFDVFPAAYENIQEVIIDEGAEGVANSAFSDCTSLQTVTFPKSLTQVGNRAFSNCVSLRTVVSHSPSVMIGDEAFSGCEKLSDIDFDWMYSIGEESFAFCNSLTEINLPAKTLVEGERAFFDCKSLICLTLEPRDFYAQGMTNLFGTPLVPEIRLSKLETGFIPKGLDLSGVAKLTIPEGAKASGERLYLPPNVTEVSFPASLTVATNLIRGGIKYTVAKDNPSYLSDDAHCLFSKNREKLLAYSNGGDSHYRVAIRGSAATTIKEIGDKAFLGCNHLRYLEISSCVERIGESAFEGLPNLESVSIDGVNRTKLSTNCAHNIVMLGNQIQKIGKRAFYGCPKLRIVSSMPDTLSSLGDGAFAMCPQLTSLWFWGGPPSVAKTADPIGVFTGSGAAGGHLIGYYLEDVSNKWAKVLGGTNWWQGAYFVMDETKKVAYEEALPAELHSWVDQLVGRAGYNGENLSKVIWNTTSARGFKTDAGELDRARLLGIEPKMVKSGDVLRLYVNSEFKISDWSIDNESRVAFIEATVSANEGNVSNPFMPIAMPVIWVNDALTKPWVKITEQPVFHTKHQDDHNVIYQAEFDLSEYRFSRINME